MKPTETEEEPILDPKLQEQLQMEIFGVSNADGSLESNQNKSIGEIKNNTNLTSGMLFVGASMVGLLGMQFPFLFIKNAPYMATPARKVRDALKFIERKRNIHSPSSKQSLSPPTFVDLGSGDGQAVYEAAKLGYNAVGIEFNWTLWALSSLRRHLFWSPEVKRRSRFLLQDFSNYNLKKANTIMIFAVPRTMPILGQKIQSECSYGTNIMAYRFKMPLADSTSTISKNEKSNYAKQEDISCAVLPGSDGNDDKDLRLRATCVYDQEEMRIYRMGE